MMKLIQCKWLIKYGLSPVLVNQNIGLFYFRFSISGNVKVLFGVVLINQLNFHSFIDYQGRKIETKRWESPDRGMVLLTGFRGEEKDAHSFIFGTKCDNLFAGGIPGDSLYIGAVTVCIDGFKCDQVGGACQ